MREHLEILETIRTTFLPCPVREWPLAVDRLPKITESLLVFSVKLELPRSSGGSAQTDLLVVARLREARHVAARMQE